MLGKLFFPILGEYIADLPEQYKLAMQKARFYHIPGRGTDMICFRCSIQLILSLYCLTNVDKYSISFDEEVNEDDVLLQVSYVKFCDIVLMASS